MTTHDTRKARPWIWLALIVAGAAGVAALVYQPTGSPTVTPTIEGVQERAD